MVNHLEQASAFRRTCRCSIVVFAISASKIAQIAPGSLQEPPIALKMPARALQERFKRLLAAITQLSCNAKPLYIVSDLEKATPGPRKSMNSIKAYFLKNSGFELESPLGLDFGASWASSGSLLALKMPPRPAQERPRHAQERSKRPPRPAQERPRGLPGRPKRHPRPLQEDLRLPRGSRRPPGSYLEPILPLF